MREVRITTNIAHLSAARFKSIEFPIPPLVEQEQIIQVAHGDVNRQAKLERSLEAAHSRVEKLSQAVLDAAFRGELVDQDPKDEPVDVPLARTRAKRQETAAAATHEPGIQNATMP